MNTRYASRKTVRHSGRNGEPMISTVVAGRIVTRRAARLS